MAKSTVLYCVPTTSRPLSRSLAAALLSVALLCTAAQPGVANRFGSPEQAYEIGISAYRGGTYDEALPALEAAAKAGIVEARFFLARILADAGLPFHDPAKAYKLYLAIADEYANLDRTDPGAPFVSKSLIALAQYLRQGISSAGIATNVPRALQYLDHAAKYFGDPDAQFEIAKLYLSGDGLPKDTELALHWLSTLTRGGHPGAQAVLAGLFWDGGLLKRDRIRALGLAILAMEQAPETDHFWIADMYQNIFCGSDVEVRQNAEAFANLWRLRFGRLGEAPRDRTSLGFGHRLFAIRTCSSGELVPARSRPSDPPEVSTPAAPPANGSEPAPAPPATPLPNGTEPGRGGFMLRETGAESGR